MAKDCTLEELVNAVTMLKNKQITIDQLRGVYLEFMKIDIESWIRDDTTFDSFYEKIKKTYKESCTDCENYNIKVNIFNSLK